VRRMSSVFTVALVAVVLLSGCRDSDAAKPGAAAAKGDAPAATGAPDAAAGRIEDAAGGAGLGSGTDAAGSTGGSATASGAPAKADQAFPRGAAEVVRTAVPVENYHALFGQAAAAKYRPTFLDGYDVAGKAYFNVVFRPDSGPAWYEYTEMSATGYQARFNDLKAKGYRPVLVESYLNGGQPRYAAIWEKVIGPEYYAFHGLIAAKMQALVTDKMAAGLVPVQTSGVTVNGTTTFAGLLVKRNLGASWTMRAELTESGYQSLFSSMTAKGMRPGYLNAYTVGGSVRFVALFAAAERSPYQSRHGLTGAELTTQIASWTKAGYQTRGVAGYAVGGSPRFAAYWSK
jgi:hypothetical protein